MNHIAYRNDETMDFLTWASRHRGIKNDMGRAFGVCQEFPAIVDAMRSYRTGARDVRAAVDKYVPVQQGNMDSFLRRDRIRSVMVSAWRKYQAYLRSRNDRDAVEQHVVQREAYESGKGLEPVDPIAQSSSDA